MPFAVDDLLEWAFVFLVLVLPVLRRVFGRGEDEATAQPTDPRRVPPRRRRPDADEDEVVFERIFEPEEPADDGMDAWKRLLRGEETAAPPPAPPAPAPPVPPTRVSPTRVPAVERASARTQVGGLRSNVGKASLESEPFGDVASLSSGLEALGGEFSSLDVRTNELDARPNADDAVDAYDLRAARSDPFAGTDWRRAMVLREVLGPPLALRPFEEGPRS